MTHPMTITEKILAAHAGLEYVTPDDLITVNVDLALANDITAPLAIRVFREIGKQKVFDRDKIALVADHFVPNKDIASAQQAKLMRGFAQEQNIRHYYELGDGGVEHVILPEKGLVVPGDLVIGADSHTCTYGALGAFSTGVGSTDLGAVMATGMAWLKVPPTIRVEYEGRLQPWVGGKDLILFTLGQIGVEGANYKSLEFTGEVIRNLPMDHRFTMANMAVEGGAKNGIVEPDDMAINYVSTRSTREPRILKSDGGASYDRVLKVRVDEIEPQIAFPHSPDNVRPVSRAGLVQLDQVFIGSCTNGRLDDLRVAAAILKNKRVANGTRLIVLPGSQSIYRTAIQEGLLETFVDAGAVVGPPSCGPCLGGHLGILAEGERALSTTNRNFLGRMGHPKSEVYLANPAVAAASAVLGRIGSPEEV
ncbi:MAG: 3-isopropylmalate dehydratase large subunit [Deltaproteobacteria bacterium]|nr:3-isopropylmalate dehydratase large subunit [Deltaproteobacteria bacterium]NTV57826.1 3-isopropylmalate dehydratase large subunit [Deltaproteobacteria bacterium]